MPKPSNWPSLLSNLSAKAILKRKLKSNLTSQKEKIRVVSNSKLVVKNTACLNWVSKLLNELKVTLDNSRLVKLHSPTRMPMRSSSYKKRHRSRNKNKIS